MPLSFRSLPQMCRAGGTIPHHRHYSAFPGTELPEGTLTCPPSWKSGTSLRVTHESCLVRTPPGTQPCAPSHGRSAADGTHHCQQDAVRPERLVCSLCVWEESILFACHSSEARTSKRRRKRHPGTEEAGDRGQGVASAEGNAQGLAGLGLQELPRGLRLSALHGCQQARGDGTGPQTV